MLLNKQLVYSLIHFIIFIILSQILIDIILTELLNCCKIKIEKGGKNGRK